MRRFSRPTPPGAYLAIVVVLFGQRDDQLNSGFTWMKVHINHRLRTKGRIPNACVGGFDDQVMSLEIRGIGS